MNKELICITCPLGCRLSIVMDDKSILSITGNQCGKGELYAREEMLRPRRSVTAVVKTNSLQLPYLPVKTSSPILKQYIPALLDRIYHCRIQVPVAAGTVLFADFQGTGVDVLLTRGADK